MKRLLVLFLVLLLGSVSLTNAQTDDFVFGDLLPTAPELAARGDYAVGVQMLELVDAGRVDILSANADNPAPLYDRPLTVEVWYPATLADGEAEFVEYTDFQGRADDPNAPNTPFTFAGRAARDAAPDASDGPYPLVVVSHGFPGSAYMMTYLTENLASKGYVVVSIAHTESTFTDVSAFGSTLLNRSQDQLFIVDEFSRLNQAEGFLNGLVDADNSAIIGYSMGGYGALNAIGAGYNGFAGNFGAGAAYADLTAGSDAYAEILDERVKAAVLIAPWGGNLGALGLADVSLWDDEALADISVPTFWIVGSQDDVSLFSGVERLFNASVNSQRHMLVYENALHNTAPNPPPREAVTLGQYERYADPVWDERHINNVNQHFITAFLGYHLKGDESMAAYLDVAVENGNEAVFAANADGSFGDAHTYWAGFSPRTALGLRLLQGE